MKIKVSKYISKFLVKNGIRDCFMVTGGGAMHLNDAIGHQEGLCCTFHHLKLWIENGSAWNTADGLWKS